MRLGVDLGGTKIEIIALGDDGAELLRRRVDTPREDYPEIIDTIEALIGWAEVELGETGSVGIGTPGALSPATGRIKNASTTCLNGRSFKTDVERALGRSVRIANDADCFALSEAIDGAAADAQVVFGAILGTGVGGGVVVRGQVLAGPNAIAGEWGHNPLPWPRDDERPGPACYCGKRGCVETFVSGPGLARDHRAVTGEALSTREIVARAATADAGCEATLVRYEDRLARALAHVIDILDPDVIVLGGGLSGLQRLYTSVLRLWGAYVFSDRVDTPLRRPRFGDSSGVRGAAWLWQP